MRAIIPPTLHYLCRQLLLGYTDEAHPPETCQVMQFSYNTVHVNQDCVMS